MKEIEKIEDGKLSSIIRGWCIKYDVLVCPENTEERFKRLTDNLAKAIIQYTEKRVEVIEKDIEKQYLIYGYEKPHYLKEILDEGFGREFKLDGEDDNE